MLVLKTGISAVLGGKFMPRLKEGEYMPEFHYQTPFMSECSVADTVQQVKGKTALIFLRYYGCTLCQYEMHQYARQYEKVKACGGQILVVLQSEPEKLAAQTGREDFPFEIICDPEQKLYKQLEIPAAKSMLKMADVKTVSKMVSAKAGGFKHGEYEGEELQLPAVFIMDQKRYLSYVHYGKSAGDIPDIEELCELLRKK